jgi:hypothetical protein
VKRTGVEEHSIAELLDDSIVKLLMKSDGIDTCALQLELTQTARSHAGICAASSHVLGQFQRIPYEDTVNVKRTTTIQPGSQKTETAKIR